MTEQSCVHSRTPFFSGAAVACIFALFAFAADAAEPIIITSASKQFIVRGQPQRSMLAASAREDSIYLDPALLAVTCERVKQTLTKELGWGDRWRSTIYINIHPVRSDNEQPDIHAFRTVEGWRYRADVPDEMDRTRLLETIVETLLLEFADRASVNESVELPPWLVEGLTAHLMQGALAGAALQARSLREIAENPELRAARLRRHADTDLLLRQRVQQTGALTIDELNWPDFEDNDSAHAEAYRRSAHLFVRELLRLRGGADCICAMLAMLPEHLNWQTAFLRAFEPHFRRMLDAEKWWSLTLTQLKRHETSVIWSAAEAQQKLDEVLFTPMEVRVTRDQLPQMTPVALQTIINDWDFKQQLPLLQAKMVQLQAAHLRLPRELLPVADSYRVTLEKYIRARAGAWFEMTARAAVKTAILELNALDEKRAKASGKMLTASASEQSGAVPLTPH